MSFLDKEKNKLWIYSYNKALGILRKKHLEEFDKIFREELRKWKK